MFFLSLFLIFIISFIVGSVLRKIKIPVFVGYIFIGIALSPYLLGLIDAKILNISSELRTIALIIILLRAGLTLNIADLKKIGRPAIFLCFLPATFELLAVGIFAPVFFEISRVEAFLMGSVLGAVSPAVVVPRMIKMIEDKKGTNKGIPQLIMAGASLDDIFVILIFTSLLTIASGNSLSIMTFINVPISVVLGVLVGLIVGILMVRLFKKISINITEKVLILLMVSIGLYGLEQLVKVYVTFSSLIASMTLGIVILYKLKDITDLQLGFNKLWIAFEVLLFVLVGASVEVKYFFSNLLLGLLVVIIGLFFRSIGVIVSLLGTKYNFKEKIFIIVSYLPKATVQASIGPIALSMGLPGGELILSVAVIAILITAPIGAIGIDFFSKRIIDN